MNRGDLLTSSMFLAGGVAFSGTPENAFASVLVLLPSTKVQ